MSVNKVILIGNVGQDPEMKTTQNGFTYVRMSLATSEYWTDKKTQEKKTETTWHNLKVYDKLAGVCMSYVKKGTKLYVEGSIRNSEYEKEGQKMRYSEVVVRNIQLLDSREAQEPIHEHNVGLQKPSEENVPESISLNDSIPW